MSRVTTGSVGRRCAPLSLFALAVLCAMAQEASAAGSLIIDAFRVRGPSGAQDEYVQVYNDSATPHTVAAISGTGYAIAASDGVTRCTIPNATVIPARGHFLCTNSAAYSLSGYATGDATFTTDIPDNAGIALFNNNTGGASFTLANRFDAVGSTSEAIPLYKEGTGYPALTPFSIDYSWVRDQCGRGGLVNAIGACPSSNGLPKDSDNNAADFYFVDTNGTSAGGGQRLGRAGTAAEPREPDLQRGGHRHRRARHLRGPSPRRRTSFATSPAIRRTTPRSARSTFAPRSRTTPARRSRGCAFASSTSTRSPRPPASRTCARARRRPSSVTVDRPPCGSGTGSITVQGTTLEQPPSQPNGTGFYGSLSVGAVTAGTPLANGGFGRRALPGRAPADGNVSPRARSRGAARGWRRALPGLGLHRRLRSTHSDDQSGRRAGRSDCNLADQLHRDVQHGGDRLHGRRRHIGRHGRCDHGNGDRRPDDVQRGGERCMTANGTVTASVIRAGAAIDALTDAERGLDQHRQHGDVHYACAHGDHQPGGRTGRSDRDLAGQLHRDLQHRGDRLHGYRCHIGRHGRCDDGNGDRRPDDLQRGGQRHDRQRHGDGLDQAAGAAIDSARGLERCIHQHRQLGDLLEGPLLLPSPSTRRPRTRSILPRRRRSTSR